MLKKSFYLILITALGLGFLLYGCGGKTGEEPNDKITEAVKLNISDPFEMKLNPKEDIDWYKVDVNKQGYLRVSAADVPENINPEASFANYNEWEEDNEVYLRKNIKLPAAAAVFKKGTYYVKIEDDYHDKASSQSFPIKIDFVEEMDKFEPNNVPEEAKTIKDNDVIEIAVYPDKDQNWFKMKVKEQGYIAVKAKGVPEEITPEVKFAEYDEWADPKVKTLRNWDKIPAACFIPKKGEYYLCFKDDYDDNMSPETFDIKINFIAEIDKYESNDKFTEAKLLERGKVIKPAIYPRKDKDYFRFILKENKKVKFVARNNSSDITPEVKIYRIKEDNPEELTDVSSWKKCPAEFELELDQGYYLLLHDDYNDKASEETFEFKME
ncbi:MAG: hypothetical protein FXF47_08250 [Candidatus Mcinerneyibacterium aminivorans]|uniref:Uncharacterized protein n=1 Tax=Candidatus Mcinerneyibacterium aminivorans TaxID=2703815 RepID=A0A5D0MFD9_9BACT|nr:MAG: hypothetical protein FXF47_08250 [Candidatus Mcinerneyibacterium aminivorans]